MTYEPYHRDNQLVMRIKVICNDRLGFVMIPRCASSAMVTSLQTIGWEAKRVIVDLYEVEENERRNQQNDRTFRDQVMTNEKLGYIAIPKNASSSLLNAFRRDLEWKWGVPKDAEYFAIVRDPIQRWISGMTQSFCRNKGQVLKKIYDNIDPFVDDPWFDLHQAPQHLFTEAWPNPTLFKMEHIDSLRGWLLERGITLPELIQKNVSKGRGAKRGLYEYLEESLTEEHRGKLRQFYAKDLELYERAI